MWRVSKLFVVWWGTPTSPTHGNRALRMSDFSGIGFLLHPPSLVQTSIIEVFSFQPAMLGPMGFNLGEIGVDHVVHAH